MGDIFDLAVAGGGVKNAPVPVSQYFDSIKPVLFGCDACAVPNAHLYGQCTETALPEGLCDTGASGNWRFCKLYVSAGYKSDRVYGERDTYMPFGGSVFRVYSVLHVQGFSEETPEEIPACGSRNAAFRDICGGRTYNGLRGTVGQWRCHSLYRDCLSSGSGYY